MRFRERHVHQTMVDYVTDVLTDAGWLAATPPLGAPALTILDYEPQQAGEIPPIHSVCVSIGDQGPGRAFDLGGDLLYAKYAVFIDIYPESESIGKAIASDIYDSLVETYVALNDYTNSPPSPNGEALEMSHVVVQSIPTTGTKIDSRSWRVVKATILLEYAP